MERRLNKISRVLIDVLEFEFLIAAFMGCIWLVEFISKQEMIKW
jgi:hypothetical protein